MFALQIPSGSRMAINELEHLSWGESGRKDFQGKIWMGRALVYHSSLWRLFSVLRGVLLGYYHTPYTQALARPGTHPDGRVGRFSARYLDMTFLGRNLSSTSFLVSIGSASMKC